MSLGNIVYFSNSGPNNTDQTIRIGKARAIELGIKYVVASITGNTAIKVSEAFGGNDVTIIAVTEHGGCRISNEKRKITESWHQSIKLYPFISQHWIGNHGCFWRNK